MSIWREKKGVSVVIGTLLMFTILVGMFTSIQVTQVPLWNGQIDVQAYETTYGDMLFLKSDIKNVALLKQPKSTIIRMGARYPDRMVFMNPKQGIYGLMSTENATVTVQYTVTWSTGEATYTENFTSSRLIYESMGAERTKIVYEHGLIIREFPAGSASTDTQELIVGDELYIPVLDTSLFSPKSSMRSESFSLKPFTGSYSKQNVTQVTITLPTEYPRAWADRLEGLDTAGLTVSVNETANQVVLSSTAIRQITFPGDPATDATMSAGIIYMSTLTEEGFDPTTDFPNLYEVTFTASSTPSQRTTVTTIRAKVKNVTAPFDIHADFTDLSGDSLDFDVQPNYSNDAGFPIDATSWDVPNGPFYVEWQGFTHQVVETGDIFAVSFSVYNSVLDQRYSRTAIAIRDSTNAWR